MDLERSAHYFLLVAMVLVAAVLLFGGKTDARDSFDLDVPIDNNPQDAGGDTPVFRANIPEYSGAPPLNMMMPLSGAAPQPDLN